VNGQSYRFRNYGKDKIPDAYIYTINQDNNGFLWLGTGTELIKFDGFNFYTVSFPDSIANRWVSVSLKDKNGNLWFGCSDGALFYTSNNNLTKLPDLKIQSINALLESPDGFIWVIPQELDSTKRWILKINEKNPAEINRYSISHEIHMTSACFAPDGYILIGTQENLLYCSIKNDSLRIENIIKGIEYSKVQAIQPVNDRDKFIVGVERGGIFKLSIDRNRPFLSRFPDHPGLGSLDINSI
jgi:ligand-binding sensor domain-containing protein